MPDGSKFRDFRGIEGAVKDAVEGTEAVRRKNRVRQAPAARGVTEAEARRTERKPASDEGVRAFGAPLGTEAERQRKGQSTDDSQ